AEGAIADELASLLEFSDVVRGVIVLDDVHRVTDSRVFAFLTALIRALPASWALAITAREDSLIPLARLRVSGELFELHESSLRFDAEEAKALFDRQDTDVGGAEIEAAMARTRGWPAGLALDLMSRRSPSANYSRTGRRLMFDYLAQEVLSQLPVELQRF